MNRRIAVLVALLLCAAGAVVLVATQTLGRDLGHPTAQSLPSLPEPGRADLGGGRGAAGSDGASTGSDAGDAGPGNQDGDLDGRDVRVDSAEPAVSQLDPELLAALRAAAKAAADDGIEVQVSSGWRSKDYQKQLLDEAIVRYGGREEALRWVATPDTSAHITGDAVDVSPTDAAYWMSEHGAEFGLCQTYANEIWHYELLTGPGGTCPAPLPDSAS